MCLCLSKTSSLHCQKPVPSIRPLLQAIVMEVGSSSSSSFSIPGPAKLTSEPKGEGKSDTKVKDDETSAGICFTNISRRSLSASPSSSITNLEARYHISLYIPPLPLSKRHPNPPTTIAYWNCELRWHCCSASYKKVHASTFPGLDCKHAWKFCPSIAQTCPPAGAP